jgi:hypothetical protein
MRDGRFLNYRIPISPPTIYYNYFVLNELIAIHVVILNAGDCCVLPKKSLEGFRQADVDDAGRRHRGGESGQRVAGAESSGTAAKVEREALKKKRDRRFDQPPPPHQHWHIDVSYLNVCATFYYVAARRILQRDLGLPMFYSSYLNAYSETIPKQRLPEMLLRHHR